MRLRFLHQAYLFFVLFWLAACDPIFSKTIAPTVSIATSRPTEKSLSTVTMTSSVASPSPGPITPTAKATVVPQLSSTPVALATPTTTQSVLYQMVCFSPASCVYESVALNSDGAYVPRFHFSSDESGPTHFPGYISVFAFGHFANQIAYWVDDSLGQLWLADLDYQRSHLIFSDEKGQYTHITEGEALNLYWSPDDTHLIVEVSDHSAPDLIYHLQAGLLKQWPWECDRIALSPRSKQFATWCLSSDGQTRYAVIEWGGEIWYSDQAPATELIRGMKLSPGRYRAWMRPWAWSSDGMQIAYFDPADQGGYLHIANAAGERLKVLPGGVKGLGESTFLYPDDIQWSQNGRRLLVNAYGNADHPCLHYPQDANDAPCWQVLDSETGAVLWTLADSAKAIPDITDWTPLRAAISPDGKLVVLTLTQRPFDAGFVIDIETGEVKSIDSPVNAMRWGLLP